MLMDVVPSMTAKYIVVFLAVAIPLLILAFLHYFYRYQADKDRADRLRAVIMALALAGILLTVSYIAIEEDRKENLVTLDYRAVLTTNGTSEGVVWVPVSANTEMQDALRVTKGQGTIDLVETEHGRALRIEYEGNLTVRGSLEAYEYFDNWKLTMKSEEWDDRIWAGHDPAPGDAGDVAIEVEVWRDSLYSGAGEDLDTSLVDGWEHYEFQYWEYVS